MLNEKSKSKTQQRLMGQALGVKRFKSSGGKEGVNPKDLNPEYKDEILKLSRQMSMKSLEDFASTEHKGLPENVREEKEVTEGIQKDFYTKLTPDSQYDKRKAKMRKMQNLVDYREWMKNKK